MCKLNSRKLVLDNTTQLKARYLCIANESQSAWGYRINLKILKNAINEKKKNKRLLKFKTP